MFVVILQENYLFIVYIFIILNYFIIKILLMAIVFAIDDIYERFYFVRQYNCFHLRVNTVKLNIFYFFKI